MTHHLHFSIGPVQGFVAQARRTRDLWAGSYILSYLAAHAITNVIRVGGKIVRPIVDSDPMIMKLLGKSEKIPEYGTIPNQFIVVAESEEQAENYAKVATAGLERAWETMAQAVWERFVKNFANEKSKEIWQRQIRNFWDISWVVSDSSSGFALARRKFFRTYHLPAEPGDKCVLMPHFQELSGFSRANNSGKQDEFWDKAQKEIASPLDLQGQERLCAISLVKRLFATKGLGKKSIGWEPSQQAWESVTQVATRTWLQDNKDNPSLQKYFSLISQYTVELQRKEEWVHLADLDQLSQDYQLDGSLSEIRDALKVLTKELGHPPRFYALLLADGDRLGKLLQNSSTEHVSQALLEFTNEVPKILTRNSGKTIYAGGDDVLALLPLETALDCANEIQLAYKKLLGTEADGTKVDCSISAALVFAHLRSPLRTVLHEAHRLLDEVAKDQNDRDSLAIGVWKSGGAQAEWVSKWTLGELPVHEKISEIMRHLEKDSAEKISVSSLRGVMRLLQRLEGHGNWRVGDKIPNSFGESLTDLIFAEIVQTEERIKDQTEMLKRRRDQAKKVKELLVSGNDSEKNQYFRLDILPILHLLHSKGQEGDHL